MVTMAGDGARRSMSRRTFLAAGSGVLATACSHGARRRAPGVRTQGPVPAGSRKPLVIGCIAPFSGPDAAVGNRVQAALAAALAHIDNDLGGSYLGFHPTVVQGDAPLTAADGVKAYRELTAQKVDAVLWCGSPGLEEALPDIVRDLLPVIAVATDLQGRVPFDGQVPDLSTSAAAGLPIFQTAVPDTAAVDLLLDYAHRDRGFDRAALLFSTTSHRGMDVYFDAACKHWGIANAGMIGFDSAGGAADLMPPVQALKGTGAPAVVMLGSAREAGAAAVALDAIGARYIDAATAQGGPWHPMLLGGPRSVGDGLFARAAAGHAAIGSVGAGALLEFAGLPEFPMRDWLRRFPPKVGGGTMIGGEQGPADGLAAIVTAAARAGSKDGADIVAALESGVQVVFASSVPFSFAAGRHLALASDELVLGSLEVPPGGPYNLGQEWAKGYLPPGYLGPDLLVDFTLDPNRRAHPATMDAMLAAHLGISARPDYQDNNPGKIAACRAVH
ncbi:MAG: hypothetical protein NVS1B12_04530 [Acidimicrobiales bacterium]